jgi:hypothetical protein
MNGSFDNYSTSSTNFSNATTTANKQQQLILSFASANTTHILNTTFYNIDNSPQTLISTSVVSLSNGSAIFSSFTDNNIITWILPGSFYKFKYAIDTTSNNALGILNDYTGTLSTRNCLPSTLYYLNIIFYNSVGVPQPQFSTSYKTPNATPRAVGNVVLSPPQSQNLTNLIYVVSGSYNDFTFYFGKNTSGTFGGNKSNLQTNQLKFDVSYNSTYYLDVIFTYGTGFDTTEKYISYYVGKGPFGNGTINYNNSSSANTLIFDVTGTFNDILYNFGKESNITPTTGSKNNIYGNQFTQANLLYNTKYYFSVIFSYGSDYLTNTITDISGTTFSNGSVTYNITTYTINWNIDGSFANYKYVISTSSSDVVPDTTYTSRNFPPIAYTYDSNTLYNLGIIFYNSANIAQPRIDVSAVSLTACTVTAVANGTSSITYTIVGRFAYYKYHFSTYDNVIVHNDDTQSSLNPIVLTTSPFLTYYLNIVFYNTANNPQTQFNVPLTIGKGSAAVEGTVDTPILSGNSLSYRIGGGYRDFTYYFGTTHGSLSGNKTYLINNRLTIDVVYNTTYYLDVSFTYGTSDGTDYNLTGKGVSYTVPLGPHGIGTVTYVPSLIPNTLIWNIDGNFIDYKFVNSTTIVSSITGTDFSSNSQVVENLLNNKVYYMNVLFNYGINYEKLTVNHSATTPNGRYGDGAVIFNPSSSGTTLMWNLVGNDTCSLLRCYSGTQSGQPPDADLVNGTVTVHGGSGNYDSVQRLFTVTGLGSSQHYYFNVKFIYVDTNILPNISYNDRITPTSVPVPFASFSSAESSLNTLVYNFTGPFSSYQYLLDNSESASTNNSDYIIGIPSNFKLTFPNLAFFTIYYLHIKFSYNDGSINTSIAMSPYGTTQKGIFLHPYHITVRSDIVSDELLVRLHVFDYLNSDNITGLKYTYSNDTSSDILNTALHNSTSNSIDLNSLYYDTKYYLRATFDYGISYEKTIFDISYTTPILIPTLPIFSAFGFYAVDRSTISVTFTVTGGLYTKVKVTQNGDNYEFTKPVFDIFGDQNSNNNIITLNLINIGDVYMPFYNASNIDEGGPLNFGFQPYFGNTNTGSSVSYKNILTRGVGPSGVPLFTDIYFTGSCGSGGSGGANGYNGNLSGGNGGNGGGSYSYVGTKNFLNRKEPTYTIKLGSGGSGVTGTSASISDSNNGLNGNDGGESTLEFENNIGTIKITGGKGGGGGGGGDGRYSGINGSNGDNGQLSSNSFTPNRRDNTLGANGSNGTIGTGSQYTLTDSSIDGRTGFLDFVYYYIVTTKV